MADSINDNCDSDTSGNIVCCVDYYVGVILYCCAVYCMHELFFHIATRNMCMVVMSIFVAATLLDFQLRALSQ